MLHYLLALVPVIVSLLLSTVTNVSAAPAASGSCAPNATKYKVSATTVSPTGADYVTVPETQVNFTQGGTTPKCVIIVFSALAKAVDEGSSVFIHAVITGDTHADLCVPCCTVFTSSEEMTTNARTFVCENVWPGAHTAFIEWYGAGGRVVMQERTTVVHYFK